MKILMVVPWIPSPPINGVRIRSYYLLREVSRRHQVTLFCIRNPGEDAEDLRELRSWGCKIQWVPSGFDYSVLSKCRAVFGPLPFGSVAPDGKIAQDLLRCCLEDAWDLVHIQGIEFGGCVRKLVGRRPLVFDMVDCTSLQMLRRVQQVQDPIRRAWYFLQYRKFRRTEALLLTSPLTILLASDPDRKALLNQVTSRPASTRIHLVPNGVDVTPLVSRPESDDPPRLVFTGNMAYPPNEDAVYYFCRQILPLIHRKRPDVWLDVIGNHPSVRLRRFCGRSKQVAVLGFVPDLRAEVIRRTLYVSPLRIGTGIKLKILEAMACGMPIVATPTSVEGMPVEDGRHVLVARSPEEFATRVLEALASADLRQRLGAQALTLVRERYSWDGIGRELERIYQETVR